MTQAIRWGVLGCASIAAKAAIPGIQSSRLGRVTRIASRGAAKAKEMAGSFGIAKSYGSYEDLRADPEIDAIYNPLPNHLGAPLTIKALEQGKAASVAEVRRSPSRRSTKFANRSTHLPRPSLRQAGRDGARDAIANMKAIDALFRSAASGHWKEP